MVPPTLGLPFGRPQNDKLRHFSYVIFTKSKSKWRPWNSVQKFASREVKIPRFRFTGTSIAILFTFFADVSIFTRNFYPFPRGKPWSRRKRQTGTGVLCLLFVGRLNSKNFQHLTQINNAYMLVKVFNRIYGEPEQRKLPFSNRFSHAGVSWIS